jgi:hypothetical protein
MTILHRVVPWVVGALVLTITLTALHLTAQQLDRQGADEQPIRLASQLASLDEIPDVAAADRVDLASSQAVFYVVYDASGAPVAGSGYLDGDLAQVPEGVVSIAAEHGENGVTWQPRDGLRFATIELAAGDGVIMAGQSLAPSETRTQNLGTLLLLGWVAGLVLLTIGAIVHVRVGAALD